MKIQFLKANNGDSILLSFNDGKGVLKTILIDGGTRPTYYNSTTKKYGDLYDTIETLKKENQKINLLILTHIDDDHIGGILTWLENDKEAYKWIEKVWFNSGKSIADYLQEPENDQLKIEMNIFDDNHTSIPQGVTFEKYILDHKLWDKKIIIANDQVINQLGIAIQILSPNKTKLEKLLKEYSKPKYGYFTSGEETDWDKSISDFIAEEKSEIFKFDEDSSVPNGSSIAFVLTLNKKNYIFLGDSHPSVIVESLKSKYSKENPIKAELLKVAHHGSSYNTNKQLLQLIETNNYILSSDSTVHNLPNKRLIARIINKNPNATLHFNYEKLIDFIFTTKDRTEFPNFKAKNISEYKVE